MKKLYSFFFALLCVNMLWANTAKATAPQKSIQMEMVTLDDYPPISVNEMLSRLEGVWNEIPEEKKSYAIEEMYENYRGQINDAAEDFDFALSIYYEAMAYLLNLRDNPDPFGINAMLDQLSELWNQIPDEMKDSDTEHTYEIFCDRINDAANDGDIEIAQDIYEEALEFLNSLLASVTGPNALEDVSAQSDAQKIFLDGQVVIMKDGRRYNAVGIEL